MTPIQQLFLGVGAKKKTYLDDLFSTYLHAGNETAKSIVNGVNLAKGGMVWTKNRSHTGHNYLFDTERGATKYIKSNQTNVEGYDNNTLTSFNNNGFSLGVDTSQNENGRTFSTWSFRKSKGFFDVVKYTGNGTTGRTVSHSLGSVPGLIIIKAIDSATSWFTYHRDLGPSAYVMLNHTNAEATSQSWFMNDVTPTSTQFTLGSSTNINGDGTEYIAYLFAGGESTNTLARSVEFDQSTAVDRLTWSATSDFAFGTGDMTIEFWYKQNSATQDHARLCHFGPYWNNNDSVALSLDGANSSGSPGTIKFNSVKEGEILSTAAGEYDDLGQWHHVAVTRSSGVFRLFVDGTLKDKNSSKTSADLIDSSTNSLAIAGTVDRMVTECFDGSISNFRVVKGTAVYTSSFKPPTEPLTNITNTKLLCCNNSSVTGSTVTPGTISSSGGDARIDSPFDDPAAFTFGENEDQGIVKCGSYSGLDSDGPTINLGWEPQWILIKRSTGTGNWLLFDSMRGVVSGYNDSVLYPDGDWTESDAINYIQLNPTGFKFNEHNNTTANNAGDTYIYLAIRRPDGYVGKPAEVGTDVFAMDTGNGSTTIPSMDSGFPVDFGIIKSPDASTSWNCSTRLTRERFLKTDTTETEGSSTGYPFDSNVGWGAADWLDSARQSWMFKRHAGFDVVAYAGNDDIGIGSTSGQAVPHSLSKTPEMIWVKCRGSAKDWKVYHKSLNGGTNPEQYHLVLNSNAAEVDSANIWNDIASTSTHFTLGDNGDVNDTGKDYIAMLFASVDGISKVGVFDGSNSDLTISNLGFQPRFLMVKRVNGPGNWNILDTTRGWGTGNDPYLVLSANTAQNSSHNIGYPTSDGFVMTGAKGSFNEAGNPYLYYAHA